MNGWKVEDDDAEKLREGKADRVVVGSLDKPAQDGTNDFAATTTKC